MTDTTNARAEEAAGKFALSVDVEDYFQVWAFSDVISRTSWDEFPFRVGESTRRCLDLFDEHKAKATFFMLGWVAERDPSLVSEIVSRGHELASHGFDHTKVNAQSCAEFREDIGKTKKILEDISGVAVKGYRAASFSIDATTPWAHETLMETGYLYSSSSHPVAHDHYGDPRGRRDVHHPLESGEFIEAPVATVDIFGKRLSCAGGGRFRASPTGVSKALLKRAAASLDGPAIFFFHPWEIDAEQPRIENASSKSKLRHYLNIAAMPSKLSHLLRSFQWRRIDTALGLGEPA